MPNKMLAVCWVVFLVLALLFGLSGCSSEATAQEISSKTINAMATLHTDRYTQTLQIVLEVTGGIKPGNLTMSGRTTGSENLVSQEAQTTNDVRVEMTGVASKLDVSHDTYFVGGWMYMKAVGYPWYKEKLPEDTWASESQIGQQTESLKRVHNLTRLDDENIDGVDCYVLQATPELNSAIELGVVQELDTYFGSNISVSSVDWGNVVKYLSVRKWISKNEHLVVKLSYDLSIEILPQDLGNTTIDMTRINVNATGQTNYYDYNKPVVIQLPPDAQSATELPLQ